MDVVIPDASDNFDDNYRDDVLQAMGEYAKQDAIAFSNWINTHELDFQPALNGQWIGLDMEYISSDRLYDLYLKSK